MPGKKPRLRQQIFIGETVEARSRYFIPVIESLEPLLKYPDCHDFVAALIMAMHRGLDGGVFHVFAEEHGKTPGYVVHNDRDFEEYEEKRWWLR